MRLKVRKVGNSLVMTIPKEYAQALGLAEQSAVDAEVRDGSLVVSPARPTWDELREEAQRIVAEKGVTEDAVMEAIYEMRYGDPRGPGH